MKAVVKSQETKEGVRFRIYNTEKKEFQFAELDFQNYFYILKQEYLVYEKEFIRKFSFCIEKIETLGKFVKIIFSNNPRHSLNFLSFCNIAIHFILI